MNDKILLELLNNYLLCNEFEDLENYIINNNIDNNDYKKLALVLIKKSMFDYVDCNNYIEVINNIDNNDFINDENNYI